MQSDHSGRPRPGGGDERPSPHRPRLWVETWAPSSSTPTPLTVLNDWVHGFWTHYLPGQAKGEDRTKPCLAASGGCPWCPLVRNRTWKGYLGVHADAARRPSILEITTGAWETCDDLRAHDGQLRGRRYDAYRERPSNRSRMLLRHKLALTSTPRFGRVDVLSVLARLWGIERDALAAECKTDDGLLGWGHPECTLTDEEIFGAAAARPFPTERQMSPAADAREWRRLRNRPDHQQREAGA